MTARAYGQFCGFSRALEVLGERWALLIVRDLLVSPKRFTDLLRGLPGIPTNVLTARLKELEAGDVIERRVLPRPAGSIVYTLTAYGLELKDTVFALGRWGAKRLGDPRPGEVVTTDSVVSAMRTTFRESAAAGVHARYEVRLGEVVVHMIVDDGALESGAGSIDDPDLIVESGPGIKCLMAGELTPAEAVENGSVKITGDFALLERFVAMFRIHEDPVTVP